MEGCFGSVERKYSLDLIMARLPKGAESSISMAFLVMCAEKILRLLRFFLIVIYAWFCTWYGARGRWVALGVCRKTSPRDSFPQP